MVADKIDQARQLYMELLQVKVGARIETLLNNRHPFQRSCGSDCNASYLGLLLRKLTENKISYSASVPERLSFGISPSPFFTVSFEGLSPTSIFSMVNSWISKSPCGSLSSGS